MPCQLHPVTAFVSLPKTTHCRFWEYDAVIYSSLAGDTHLLEGVGLALFHLLAEGGCGIGQLAESLSTLIDWPAGVDPNQALEDLLVAYQELSLVTIDNTPTA